MRVLKSCPYCDAPLYTLGDGMRKCSRCRKKTSPKRYAKIAALMEAFCHGENALVCAKRLNHSYTSVLRYFDTFRTHAALICEHDYEQRRHLSCEYEEYFYLAKANRKKKHAVFDAQNFITFDYGGHLYTIVLPSLHTYRDQFIADELEPVYLREFERFKRQSRIIKIASHNNSIVRFWDYFEANITDYRGVSSENFPLYLKEMEFKFNHDVPERIALLHEGYYRMRA